MTIPLDELSMQRIDAEGQLDESQGDEMTSGEEVDSVRLAYLNRCAAAVEWVGKHKAEVSPATAAFPSWAVLLPAAVTYAAHGASWLSAIEAAMEATK